MSEIAHSDLAVKVKGNTKLKVYTTDARKLKEKVRVMTFSLKRRCAI